MSGCGFSVSVVLWVRGVVHDLIGLDQVVVARERRAEAGNGIPSGPGGRALAHTGAFVLFVCDLWCNSTLFLFIYLFFYFNDTQ